MGMPWAASGPPMIGSVCRGLLSSSRDCPSWCPAGLAAIACSRPSPGSPLLCDPGPLSLLRIGLLSVTSPWALFMPSHRDVPFVVHVASIVARQCLCVCISPPDCSPVLPLAAPGHFPHAAAPRHVAWAALCSISLCRPQRPWCPCVHRLHRLPAIISRATSPTRSRPRIEGHDYPSPSAWRFCVHHHTGLQPSAPCYTSDPSDAVLPAPRLILLTSCFALPGPCPPARRTTSPSLQLALMSSRCSLLHTALPTTAAATVPCSPRWHATPPSAPLWPRTNLRPNPSITHH